MIEGYGHIVLASTSGDFVASAIRFFTGPKVFTPSRYSHAFVTMPPLLGVPMCAEDSSAGVDMLRFDTGYLQNPAETVEVWQLNIPQASKDAGLQAVIGKLEQSYGYLEIPWFIWRWLNRLVGRDIKHQDNWSQTDSVCSGLVRNQYIENNGLKAFWAAYGQNSVCPQDLRDIMVTRPDLFTMIYSNFT